MATAHSSGSDGHDSDSSTDRLEPSDWGWHADLGALARIGGIFSLIALGLMLTATNYNHAGSVAILFFMALIVIGLIWDRHSRRTAWRR